VSQMHSSGHGHRAQELGTVSANVEQLDEVIIQLKLICK
jgi:hypothetical protein